LLLLLPFASISLTNFCCLFFFDDDVATPCECKSQCGFDFAAGEDNFPAEAWLPTVQIVKQLNIPLTVHSGEGSSAKNIEEVIRLYEPQRLGHATSLIEDPNLMAIVKQKNILVESCPTSNLITGTVSSYADHPLQTYLRYGIPVCINDDDGTLFDVDENDEWYACMKFMGLTKDDMIQMNNYAAAHSFVK